MPFSNREGVERMDDQEKERRERTPKAEWELQSESLPLPTALSTP